MFSTARQIYILDKGENPSLKMGSVEFISQPTPKYQTTFPYNTQIETTVDIKTKVGDEPVEFKQLPSNQSVFTYGNVIVTDSKDAMNAEVERVLRESKAILDSVPIHENMVSKCNQFLMDLNPQYAKDKQQEERISGMEQRMGGIENSLKSIQDMLSSALNNKK